MSNPPLELSGVIVAPGNRRTIWIPIARRYTAAEVSLPVSVIRGRKPGPCLFVSAAIHGDEINGVEIVRRLLKSSTLGRLRGSLIAAPVVNIYGFVAQTRYLPDRRDLNRSFPGLDRRITRGPPREHVHDGGRRESDPRHRLHTGSLHRANLPQIRVSLDFPGSEQLARSFGAPVILDSTTRPGSLRESVSALGIPMIVYEAGEALRFDELSIRAGLRGVISVMRDLGMLPAVTQKRRRVEPFVAHGSRWIRAPESGILVTRIKLGSRVEKGQKIGAISDSLGEHEAPILSPTDGVLIGRTNLPLMNEGDAVFHIGVFERVDTVLGIRGVVSF